jgi:uncharacterized RDD family membrane protein YckC
MAVKQFAQFWKRLLAYVIDMLVISFIVIAPFIEEKTSNFNWESLFSVSTQAVTTEIILTTIALALLSLVYWVFMEYTIGQTVGKVILGLEVQSEKGKKKRLSQIILRNITKISTALIAVDTLYLLITKKHQRFTEKLSKTVVIEGVTR